MLFNELSQIKEAIRSNTDYMEGTVRSTSGRFGFAILDDGREAFINPDQMSRVFHGDRIEVIVTLNEREQHEAQLNKLLHSSLKEVVGRYMVKGKGHFIVCEGELNPIWLFVPPKARKGAQDGDFVCGVVTQHPFKTGKSQAKVTDILGNPQTPFIERAYTLAKFQLSEQYPEKVIAQVNELISKSDYPNTDHDHSHLPFVTIDSQATRDMDDALCIEALDDGWLLSIAIANPSSEIALGSPLDRYMTEQAHTLYFLGKNLPMMPDSLSTERYSLMPQQKRPALVCQLRISAEGAITEPTFFISQICSQAKLSYQQVSALLNGEAFEAANILDDAQPFLEPLQQLQACTQAMNRYRHEHSIVLDNREDFCFHTNSKGQIERIEPSEKTIAHTMVEEAMLAINHCAGILLSEHNAGIHNTHDGFKAERRADIEALLKEKLNIEFTDTSLLNDYRHIMQHLIQNDNQAMLSICQRFLQPGELSDEPKPHFGLGIEHYAMVSSPIRRYQDFYNHHMLIKILSQQELANKANTKLDTIKSALLKNKEAIRFLENRLICIFLSQRIGEHFKAKITMLSNQGIGIRLLDSGIEGFVQAKKPNKKKTEQAHDKLSFNNQRMELKWNECDVLLDTEIDVILTEIDHSMNRLAFQWPNAPAPIKPDETNSEASNT